MSQQQTKKEGESKKPSGKKNFRFPPGFPEFPQFPGFPSFDDIAAMPPMPGMEEEYEMAMKTLESICNTDFTKEIDLENVCGHRAPGVEMKEGYCLDCFEKENISQLIELLDLADQFGPESAVQMMQAPSTSSSTSGASSSSSTSSTAKKSEKKEETIKKPTSSK